MLFRFLRWLENYQTMNMIRHYDEIIQLDVCVVLGKFLPGFCNHVAIACELHSFVNGAREKVTVMVCTDSKEVSTWLAVIKAFQPDALPWLEAHISIVGAGLRPGLDRSAATAGCSTGPRLGQGLALPLRQAAVLD